MKLHLPALVLASCLACGAPHHPGPEGQWRLQKIKIFKGDSLRKLIDTGSQYWHFKTRDIIEISNDSGLQNVLHVVFSDSLITSFDSSGKKENEFLVKSLDSGISITSKLALDDGEYKVVYYLQRMDSLGH